MSFFDDVRAKVQSIANGIADYVGGTVEACQIMAEKHKLEVKLETLYTELGKLSYHGSTDEAGTRPSEVIFADIADVKALLKEIDEMLEEETEAVEEPEESECACVYCRKCGHPQEPDSDFCPKCGTKLIK